MWVVQFGQVRFAETEAACAPLSHFTELLLRSTHPRRIISLLTSKHTPTARSFVVGERIRPILEYFVAVIISQPCWLRLCSRNLHRI